MSGQVLIADDHPLIRQGLRTLLEQHGFTVIGEAADGREATQLAQELEPDVAVLDLAMPLLNGLDAAREITRASRRTQTIVVTVHTADQHALAALPAGGAGARTAPRGPRARPCSLAPPTPPPPPIPCPRGSGKSSSSSPRGRRRRTL